MPRIRMMQGERIREFVLSHEDETRYLEAAPQPLKDIALLVLDTGLRIGEARSLSWQHVHFEPAGDAKFGYIHVPAQKSEKPRNVPLTDRANEMLQGRRRRDVVSLAVFGEGGGQPMLTSSLDHLHAEVREALKMSGEFVIHSLRHTYGTRLGEAGAGAFEIMRLMGHASVTTSQRYVHPTPEAIERAVARLQEMNQKAAKRSLQIPLQAGR